MNVRKRNCLGNQDKNHIRELASYKHTESRDFGTEYLTFLG